MMPPLLAIGHCRHDPASPTRPIHPAPALLGPRPPLPPPAAVFEPLPGSGKPLNVTVVKPLAVVIEAPDNNATCPDTYSPMPDRCALPGPSARGLHANAPGVEEPGAHSASQQTLHLPEGQAPEALCCTQMNLAPLPPQQALPAHASQLHPAHSGDPGGAGSRQLHPSCLHPPLPLLHGALSGAGTGAEGRGALPYGATATG